ncbi:MULTISPECIES: hypothetical protein [unclassified Fibrobacter]|uniref:P-loop ATPase, Sll1717 family n=1 Tax=unclassified Fibrobacter TaxID=2634177 RepID=UPI0025BEA421|nr:MULTISPECIES: hypothetical protein [unclassified Fibrobacter]
MVDLKQIDMGKNDAKLDSLEKYFYDCGHIQEIKKQNKFFVIGRKGAGKSAIACYAKKHIEEKMYVDIISFRDIPTQLMEQFYDDRFTASNKYVALWNFILSVEMSKILLDSTKVEKGARDKIKFFLELINPTLKENPKDYLNNVKLLGWNVGAGVSTPLASVNVGVKKETQYAEKYVNVIDYTNDLTSELVRAIPLEENFHLFFDELDDNYQDEENYKNMIIALFKASMDLNSKFLNQEKKASVVILLRDDIYEKLAYADKNKWRDFGIFLNWTPSKTRQWYEQELFKIANERIGASIDGVAQREVNYWNKIFITENISADTNAFDFIISRTFFRPRDIIQYVKSALEVAVSQNKSIIDKYVIEETDLKYGEWFKGELVDELFPVIPEIQEIFNVLKINYKYVFFKKDIENIFSRHKLTTKYSISELLQILYDYSIVGQFMDTKYPVFKYRNPGISLNEENKLCLHYGLRCGLGFSFRKDYKKGKTKESPKFDRKNVKQILGKGSFFYKLSR